MHLRKIMFGVLTLIIVAALSGLAIFEVREAVAACRICYNTSPGNDTPICRVADSNGDFTYTVTHVVTNQGDGAWTLVNAFSSSGSPNIKTSNPTPTLTPGTHSIPSADGIYTSQVTISNARLNDTSSEGRFAVAAYKQGGSGCSATFYTLIKPSTGSCP